MRKLKLLLLLTLLMTVGGVSLNAQVAGTYYIKNVGTGKWLGPGNNWGTQASVLQHADYWKAAKISDGVYTLESVVSNGGTSYYLTGTYCDGGATNFTLTPIAGKENTYSISNAGGGYLTTNGTTVDISAADGSAEASQWKLYSESDMAAVMAAATVENPADATYLIKDHDLGRNNRDYSAWSNTGATAPKTNEGNAGTNRYSIEAYHATFDVNQTLSSIPNGVYAIRVNGFYRQDGSNANLPYVYAGDSKTTLPVRTGSENSMQAAAVSFEAGNYLSEPAYVRVDNGTLKIGVKTEGNSCWVIFKNFHLQYYGNVTLAEVLLHEYVILYNAALNAAQDYQDDNMFDADKTALNTAISSNTIDLGGTVTEEMLTTATANLNAAVAAAAKAVVKKTAFDNIVTATEGKTDVNITSYIANLGFEDGNLNAWTSVDGGGVATNNNFSGKVGSYFVERWQNGVALGSGSLTHDVITLPTGVYTITANAQNIEQYNSSAAGTGYFFCVNDTRKEIGAAGTYTNVVKYTAQTDVTLKFLLEDCTGNWISCDNIQIVYNGEDFPAVTLVEGKMNATIAAAQTSAKEAYDADPTVDNYNTLVEAIAAAQASKNAYEHLGAAITKIDAALAAATTATETDDEAYQTIKTAYNNGTIENANIQANINNAYDAVIAIIKSQTATSADFTMAIKNQSFEYGDMTGWTATASSDTGVRETANGTYAATGTDGYYLFNTWWQGVPLTQTVTGLPNGQYTLTASVASDGATIYLIGNGEHNEGIETGGEYPSSDVMQETTFTFLVKDGTATIGVVGGADGTAGEHKDYVADGYWWYKADNFRLQKNRDLTPEEAAIVPEDLSIPSTATVFINKTTTLVPTSTTEDANIDGFVTWTSDNTSVATVSSTGVVTAVAYGTANITVTSTLNPLATATCAVTVTAPLYNEAENLDFAEGPVATTTVVTYDKDKGAGKAQLQPVTGWTIVSNGDARAGAVFEYNSGFGLGNAANTVPAAGPDGTNGYVLGIEAVWNAAAQYTQPVRLPAGAYTITLPIYNQSGDGGLEKNLIGFVEDGGTEHFASTNKYAVGSWTTETISFVLNEETFGKLSLGYDGNDIGNGTAPHLFIDRMTITYEPFASAEDYADLNDAIDAKKEDGKTLGFDEGEYAPYNNATVLQALATARAIDQEANNVQSTVQAATAALEAASWSAANTEELNAVYDGTFAAAENNGAPAGWTMSNNTLGGDYHSRAFVGDDRLAEFNNTKSAFYLRFDGTNSNRGSMYYYGNTEGYTMPLDADTYYRVTVDFAGWGSTGKPLRLNVTGPQGFEAVGQQYNTSVRADNADNTPQKFNIFFKTAGAGNYVINFQTPGADSNTHSVVISNVVLKKALENITIDEDETFEVASTARFANVTFNRTLVEGWNGLVLPFDMTVEDVAVTFSAEKVKKFTGITYVEGNGVTLNFANYEGTIPAGTPFMVKVDENPSASYEFNGVLLPTTGLQNITWTADGNDNIQYTMKGTYAASTELTAVNFALINGNSFYYHTAGKNSSSAKAFRAYFENESTNPEGARVSFDFGDGETTGITELAQPKTAADGTYYDLQGRKVENFKQKGIYILNGRKVVK